MYCHWNRLPMYVCACTYHYSNVVASVGVFNMQLVALVSLMMVGVAIHSPSPGSSLCSRCSLGVAIHLAGCCER